MISTSVAAGTTTYTDNSVSGNTSYKYAVVHRDLAYNYSTALMSGTITTTSAGPTVTTTLAPNTITTTSAISGGSTISGTVTAKGVVWNTATAPTLSNSSALDATSSTGTGNYNNTPLTGLSPQTKYFVRAYVTDGSTPGYGDEKTFFTLSNAPTAVTSNFAAAATSSSNINLTWTAATFPGAGASNNGYIILRRSDATNPDGTNVTNGVAPASLTMPSGTTLVTTVVSGATTSFGNGTGLSASTQYNYIIIPFTWDGTNSGTYNYLSSGAQTANATTLAGAPTISTTAGVTGISSTGGTSGGSGIADGGTAISERGIVWNTTGSPTTADAGSNVVTGTDPFTATLSGLNPQTRYFVRAYVINANGTAYGSEVNFRTFASAPTGQASGLSASVTANASGSITLSWTAASFPGGAAPGYVLAYGTTAPSFVGSPNGLAPASAVSSGTPVTLGNVLTTTVTGLTPGTTYNFLLVPYTWDGSNTTTNNYLTASAPSTSLMAVGTPSITTGSATVTSPTTATANASGISAASGTVSQKGIVYAKASTSTNPTLALNDGYTTEGTGTAAISNSNLGTGVAPATVLSPQTLYYYNGYVTNEAGTGYGTAASFRTWAAAPTTSAGTVGASPANATQVNLTWTAATFPSAANASVGGYLVFRSSGANAVAFTLTPGSAPAAGTNTTLVTTISTQATASYSNSGLSASTTYNYVVIPFTWDGTNAATYNYYASGYNTASATTPVGTSATDAFRSRTSGAWSSASTWSSFTGGSWMDATLAPTSSAASVLIQSTDSVAITGTLTVNNVTVDGKLNVSSGTLTVNNATSGNDLTVSSTGAFYLGTSSTGLSMAASAAMQVDGSFQNNSTTSTFTMGSGSSIVMNGIYYHNINSSSIAIPTMTWNTGSTCSVIGATSAFPATSGMGQSFYHFTWDVPTGSGTTTMGGNFPADIRGNLSFLSSGPAGSAGLLRFSTNTSYTITVGGNLTFGYLGGGATVRTEFADGSAQAVFNVGGNLNIYGGTLTLSSSNTSGKTTFNVSGDFNFLGGSFDVTVASNTASVLNMIRSNGTALFNQNGGSWAFSSTRNMTINIGSSVSNTGTIVQLQNNVATSSSGVDFVVNNGSTLDMQGFTISGNTGVATADFSVVSGGRLMTSFATGVSVSGAYTAALRNNGNRTFNAAAQFTLYGASNITATNLPSSFGALTVNMTGGATATANAALTVTGAVTLTDGTLLMGSNNLTLGGSISRSSGSINAGSNTTTFNGSSAQTVAANSFVSNTTNNLTLNGAGGVTLQGDHTVSGALTLTTGTLSIGSNVLTLAGATTRTNGAVDAGTGTVAFTGASAQSVPSGFSTSGGYGTLVINNGNGVTFLGTPIVNTQLTLTSGALTASNTITIKGAISRGSGTITSTAGTVIFNGSSLQAVPSGTFTSGSTFNLTINNASGVSLASDLSVTGALALTSGLLDVGSSTLTVTTAGLGSGGSSNYIKTSSGSGAVLVTGITAAGKTIPVGNGTYNPVTISGAATQNWTLRVSDAISNVTAPLAANIDRAVSRMWDLTPSLGSPLAQPATVTFQYNDATDVGNSFATGAKVRVWHYENVNGSNKWMAVSGYITPTGTAGAVRTVTVSGLSNFSPYAISNFDAPLPVSLLSFTGKRSGIVNELKWKTASESNNRGFAIERSVDGVTFTQVTFVGSRATGGTSTSDISYSYSDAMAAGSKWYYRLKQVDLDGQYKYSAVVLLKGEKSGLITVEGIYPNPVKATANIRLQAGATGGNVVLQLTDMQGKLVRTRTVNTEAGAATTVQLNLDGLAAGQYNLKALAGSEVSEAVTLVKQ